MISGKESSRGYAFMSMEHSNRLPLVLCSQTVFSLFVFGWEEKGSGEHPI